MRGRQGRAVGAPAAPGILPHVSYGTKGWSYVNLAASSSRDSVSKTFAISAIGFPVYPTR